MSDTLDTAPGAAAGDPVCPDCGAALSAADPEHPALLRCDACGREHLLIAHPVEEVDPGAEASNDGREDELSELRIRQLATARRAAYRARSYAVIATVACIVAAGQGAWYALRGLRRHSADLWTVLYILLALLGLAGAIFFARRALQLHHEARRSAQPPPPPHPPDFTPLGDGTRAWEKLEDVR